MDKFICETLQRTNKETRYKIVAALYPTYDDITRLIEHLSDSYSATPHILDGIDTHKIVKYLRDKGFAVRYKEK